MEDRTRETHWLLLVACAFLLFAACTERDKMFKESRVLMDTYCTITVVSPSRDRARRAIDAGFSEIKKLEVLLNYFSQDSEITAINRSAGTRPVKVSGETLEIMERTMGIARATDGAFDPTLAPVIKLWKFSKDPAASVIPLPETVQAALSLADFRKIVIDGTASEISLREEGMEIDLGGIAKGFAADKAVASIQALGIKAALVAIAGDIRGYGRNLSGEGWSVGIQDPRPDADTDKPWEEIFAVLHLDDEAISTSGDYQRFFIKEGRRYHHILDPKTGYPADSGLISVSVVAPEGVVTDSMATAVFVLGAERGMRLLEGLGIEGVLVDRDRKVYLTDDLRGRVTLLREGYEIADQKPSVRSDGQRRAAVQAS